MNNDIKKSTTFLFLSLFLTIFSIMPIYLFYDSIQNINKVKLTYENYIYKEFTIDHIDVDHDSDNGYTYTITVCEEEKKIIVNSLLTKIDVRDKLDSLKEGDKIYCYLIETTSRYEAAEIKSDEMVVLSLARYEEIYSRDGLIGVVMMPIVFLICIVGSIGCLIVGIVERKNEKAITRI